ncbi:hypothetical protein HL670_00994 [Serratia plymuthica]|uniref:DUF3131 domain-containing protein n=1 Tax=Serratia plymuthica TaxID=82996 RepID=UPI0007876509|nr:DUF3131 domain-containing protein [Serratia plymuthica]QJW54127.1 hypothetical protein HL670_00994 [Serratia plymuthica]
MFKTIALVASIATAIIVVVLMGIMARPGTDAYRWTLWQPQGRSGELSAEEQRWAKVAWRYFQNNTQAGTGLVNTKDHYPMTSLWNMGDSLIALTAARRLNIIAQSEFDLRLSTLLTTINALPLTQSGTPGALYNATNGALVVQTPQVAMAQDMARLLLGMRMVSNDFPEYATFLDRVMMRWNFCQVVDKSGQPLNVTGLKSVAATGVGYGEYNSSAFSLWGFMPASTSAQHFKTAIIYGLPIDFDDRDPRLTGTPVIVENTPYILAGLEFNWAAPTVNAEFSSRQKIRAQRLYKVQEARWRQDKILTARAEYSRTSAPWKIYDGVFANGYPWNTLTDEGRYSPELAMLSTRAIFGLWALWNTPFTDALMQLGRLHQDPEHGWFEGRYEASGGYNQTYTLTTNAIVLEALLFKHNRGALIRDIPKNGYLDTRMKDIFNWPNHCLAQERAPLPTAKGK